MAAHNNGNQVAQVSYQHSTHHRLNGHTAAWSWTLTHSNDTLPWLGPIVSTRPVITYLTDMSVHPLWVHPSVDTTRRRMG